MRRRALDFTFVYWADVDAITNAVWSASQNEEQTLREMKMNTVRKHVKMTF